MIDLPESDLRERLATALSVPRWIDEIVAAAPFSDVDALIVAAETAADPLTDSEIDAAMAHHPRIGEQPVGPGAAAEFSRREQASAADADDLLVARALAEGNATYEDRFDRVFLIRAAGRSRAEIVEELERRLKLDDETERRIVGEQLREIAVLRLRSMFGEAEGARAVEDAIKADESHSSARSDGASGR
ncbi:2-oxo-4-hydroxy-4-carboxy-5-ureidoimidazoline decarboxylase [Frigoribacterium sp. 2-23]|uniref:2-oxo-4-hydroxy-4-carboxy-5-ureidoimidazoline decarboxylase n=1 Tax=Frigoribacterium sp. 2-23 TaxID=3415006 RepID=UPI003C6F8F48